MHISFIVLYVQHRFVLWEVPVCPLHVALQGAVTLLALGEGVVCRDLLPCPVVGERERSRVLVLKEALQVSVGQFGGVFHSESIKALLLLFHVAFPEGELQEADFGAAVFVAGTQEAPDDSGNDHTPAQDLQTHRDEMD